ncbi:MAG: cyclase family protein [Kordiimonas sp.]
MKKIFVGLLSLGLSGHLQANPIDLSSANLVDLSHTYSADTLYWPTSPSEFEHKELSYGRTEEGFFYSAYSLCTPEHGGTHLDAPIHFFEGRQTVDEIPLKNLILPMVVIDVSKQSAQDRNYRLTLEDIERFEADHGQIPNGSAILLRTDWDRYWPDAMGYLGDDEPGDASNLSFPSFGAEATEFLVKQRNTKLIGLDTASIDYGKSTEFPVHQIVAEANISALENLTNLKELPPTGAYIIALPMKVGGGSGAPVRVAAILPTQ